MLMSVVVIEGQKYQPMRGSDTYADCKMKCDLYESCDRITSNHKVTPCEAEPIYFKRVG